MSSYTVHSFRHSLRDRLKAVQCSADITDQTGGWTALSCVDGSFFARINLSDFDGCRLRSSIQPFDAVDVTAGLDEVRTLGFNQTSELMSPDSASGCPNFSSL